MASSSTLKNHLNLIVTHGPEDRSNARVKAIGELVKDKLQKRECPFKWLSSHEGWFNAHLYGRAVRRNHHYVWEGYLRPTVMKILQSYYAFCKGDRLVTVKCLVMADKIMRRGEFEDDLRTVMSSVGLKHVIHTTIATVFYLSGLYSQAQEVLKRVTCFDNLSGDSKAVVYFIKALIYFHTGPNGHKEALKWVLCGLKTNPSNPDLRFLRLQLIFSLWDVDLNRKVIEVATAQTPLQIKEADIPRHVQNLSFSTLYAMTCYQRDILFTLNSMSSAVKRATKDAKAEEIYEIELAVVMNLESEPQCPELIQHATQFFVMTGQPEKANFLEGVTKLSDPSSAYRWLDLRMLLVPELCDAEVFAGLFGRFRGIESLALFKRIAMHYVMYDPELAFGYANKALAMEMHALSVKPVPTSVPLYDDKLVIFGRPTGLGFYRFMVYYAHVIGGGEAAHYYVCNILKILPFYLEATRYSEETQRILELLRKNEYYRDPNRAPFPLNVAVLHPYFD